MSAARHMAVTPAKQRALAPILGVGLFVIVLLGALITAFIAPTSTPPQSSTPPTIEVPEASDHVLEADPAPPVPPTTSQEDLALLPLADTWAVIPSLIEQGEIESRISDSYLAVAQPLDEFTALYAEQASDADPVAALGYFAVEDRTSVAVFAHEGEWLLIGTPARIALPSERGGNAPTVSFAWARAVDLVLDQANHRVVVDTSASTIALLDRNGNVVMSEEVTLGTTEAPTPTGTHAYIVATYRDAENQPYTGGEPIALVSSHSATLDSFRGDVAATGIHYSTATSANSLGCVRVSPAFARALDPLVGVRVDFT